MGTFGKNKSTKPNSSLFGMFRIVLLLVFAALWTCFGLALPLTLLVGPLSIPQAEPALLVVGLIVLASGFSAIRFEFSHGSASFDVSADVAFLLLAALVLPLNQAALVGLVAAHWAARSFSRARFIHAIATTSLSVGGASWAVHHLFGTTLTGNKVLPAAMVAACIYITVCVIGSVTYSEATVRGSGLALLRKLPYDNLLAMGVGLPALAVALSAPFMTDHFVALAIVGATEAFAVVVMRLLYREHVNDQHNNYLRETFSRYMPDAVASTLMTEEVDIHLGGTERDITVLFCDVRDFTNWAETNAPSRVLLELNRLLTDLSQAVFDSGGTLDKFTGDGLMAFWGAPIPDEHHARQAFTAMIQMFRKIRELEQTHAASSRHNFKIGIGIHSGRAMVGNIGHEQRLNYTAVGDTVNVAARLEAESKAHGVPMLMSEATFMCLPQSAQSRCARLDSIAVKGRKDRVRLYTLLAFAKDVPAKINSA